MAGRKSTQKPTEIAFVAGDENVEEIAEENIEEIAEEKFGENIVFTEVESKPVTRQDTPITQNVRVRLARKYDGCIGGVWYHFEKNELASVPENVKNIMSREEGLLKPL